MNQQHTDFIAGDLILLETGEYSDRSTTGPFKALITFELADAVETWCGHRPPVDLYDLYDEANLADKAEFWLISISDFIDWLSREGYIEDVPCITRHIGSYNRLEL